MHKYYLLSAELARLQGESQKALNFYEQAVAAAEENRYINDEALAYELMAKFYLSLDFMICCASEMEGQPL